MFAGKTVFPHFHPAFYIKRRKFTILNTSLIILQLKSYYYIAIIRCGKFENNNFPSFKSNASFSSFHVEETVMQNFALLFRNLRIIW